MPRSYLPTLLLIAQAVLLLKRGQKHRQTDRRDRMPYALRHASGYTDGVSNDVHGTLSEFNIYIKVNRNFERERLIVTY